MKNNKSLRTWLFQPFTYIAGEKALIYGLIIMVILSVLAYLTQTHFDGVIDIHIGCLDTPTPYWIHAFFQLSTWLILTIVFYITACIVSKSNVRLVDIAGTMALAQLPLLFAVFIGFIPSFHICIGDINTTNLGNMMDILKDNIVVLSITTFIYIIFSVWTILLRYNAYSISANVKGVVGVSTFIFTLIIAEVLSKDLLFMVLQL